MTGIKYLFMKERVLKSLYDIKLAISEIESFMPREEIHIKSDLFASVYVGYIWSKSNVRQKSTFLGADIGYKYMMHHPIYINPKFLIL